MKKRSAKIKLIIVGILTVLGVIASFLTFPVGDSDYVGFVKAMSLGLDLKGGVYAVFESKEDHSNSSDFDSRMNGTVLQLTQLLSAKGYNEAIVFRVGSDRIRAEVPDVDDPDILFDIIGKPAAIEFILENGETVLRGEDIKGAQAGMVQGEYVVSLSLNAGGATKFAKATSENIGKRIKIDVIQSDQRQTISDATVQSAITNGQATISGGFKTYDDAAKLADQIMSGTFSVALETIESDSISPLLGESALLSGLIGGGIAFILIMIFMCVFYRMLGGVAAGTMVIYAVLMFMFLCLLPWGQLTLPGIAGIILSIGMMIDGNIIIYERIKEEFREGKSIWASYYSGFKKATSAIVDGNITTIIAAVMLLIFGTGPIQGFGLTLLVGLILSMFATLVVTRFCLKWVLVLNSTNRNLYNLKRRDGFDEDDEIQHIKKVNEPKSKESIGLIDGILPGEVGNK